VADIPRGEDFCAGRLEQHFIDTEAFRSYAFLKEGNTSCNIST
jgi:hypothetical protein